MPEDLNIGSEQEQPVQVDYLSPHDDIAAAYNALEAVDSMDMAIMTKADSLRIRQIKRWALRIIHYHLKDIYTDIFDEKEEDEEE